MNLLHNIRWFLPMVFIGLAWLLVGCCGTGSVPGELPPNLLQPGDYRRTIEVGGTTRSYLVHVPPALNPRKPVPVVLALHGAATNATFMANITGLNTKADEAGFVVAYPNGTGVGETFLVFNAGGVLGFKNKTNDVEFTAKLLDDLATVINMDRKRVYATGYSNGGMMCYMLASELSDRIAAIAPVAGTMIIANPQPKRPVSVMHFHGTADGLVSFNVRSGARYPFATFMSVEATLQAWAKLDGCTGEVQNVALPGKTGDPTKVTRRSYGTGKDGTEVILFIIEGGGHTWPGGKMPIAFLGNTTQVISANDLMWDFFQKHPMK